MDTHHHQGQEAAMPGTPNDAPVLDQLAAANADLAARFAGDTHPDLDGGQVPTGQLPEAILLASDYEPARDQLRMLREAVRTLQHHGLDESRIEEFVSWALHGDPRNPNL